MNLIFAKMVTFVVLICPTLALACTGDIEGFWERRAVNSDEAFEAIETFKIDSSSGVLSMCGTDRKWDSEFEISGEKMSFGFARRERVLTADASGNYYTPSWIAEHKGKTYEYRVRAKR